MRGLRRPHAFDISDDDGPRVDATAPLPRLTSDAPSEPDGHDWSDEEATGASIQPDSNIFGPHARHPHRGARLTVAVGLLACGAIALFVLARRPEPPPTPATTPPADTAATSRADDLAPRVAGLERSFSQLERALAGIERPRESGPRASVRAPHARPSARRARRRRQTASPRRPAASTKPAAPVPSRPAPPTLPSRPTARAAAPPGAPAPRPKPAPNAEPPSGGEFVIGALF
jgi:hypothetical protein